MGNYLNPDISAFARVVNSEIYVDKTGLIEYTNRSAKTLQSYICISRPRRFGKSIAANMLFLPTIRVSMIQGSYSQILK